MSLEWWQKSVVYHVYLSSFKDSNNDGIGDIQGLISSLDYFVELNVSTLMLSPFYPSPMKDNGYDIVDFTDIDPRYGNMDDFKEFMMQAKNRGMHILIDFVANHTSDQHPWFLKSIEREEPYGDYYVWVDAAPESNLNNPVPPNNWLSVFDYSAWTWNEKRQQFYLHQFLPEQPDLNFRNRKVREEMKKVLVFWLEKGVDGFRVDAVSHIFEDEQLRDEPVAEDSGAKKDEYRYLDHIYTKGMKENLDILIEWRQLLEEYALVTGKSKILFVEATEEIQDIMCYYGSSSYKIADFPLNFELYKITTDTTGKELKENIESWLENMPKGKLPNWVLSSHDYSRVNSRVGKTLGLSLYMITMILPGLPFVYYGDELGMLNGVIDLEDIKDSYALRTTPSNSRDPMRTPMQWNSEVNSGFTSHSKPWLPVCEDYETVNVDEERKDPLSVLNTFKHLIKLRQEPSVLLGVLEYPLINEQIFSCLRFLANVKCYLLLLNISSRPALVDLSKSQCTLLPSVACVEVINKESLQQSQSSHSTKIIYDGEEPSPIGYAKNVAKGATNVLSADNVYMKGNQICLENIFLRPKEALILSFIGKL
ncbi:maltase A3-like [Uloborus diversus]|uniref:maltase A3-like n=1 Tax=Uloborus diversus TaxID=327109 RepID=UPI002409AFE0|nr:maltase A3-like [Uloborus diversus]